MLPGRCLARLPAQRRTFAVNKYGEWVTQPPVNVTAAYVPPDIPPIPRPNEALDTKRARLLYTARKRGILESDLLLGTWAALHLPSLSAREMTEFDTLLHENDWSIYYWLTGAQQPPPHILALSIIPSLIDHAKNKDKKILSMPRLPDSPAGLPPPSDPSAGKKKT